MKKTLLALAISSIAVGTAGAATTGYWKDSSGNYLRDGSGECVMTGNWTQEEHAKRGCGDSAQAKRTIPTPVTDDSAAKAAARKRAEEAAAKQRAKSQQKTAEQKTILEKLRSVSLSSGAAFESGSARLSSEGKAALDEFAVQLKVLGNGLKSVQVEGHTDSTGSDAVNQRISEQRAQAVKDYLVSKGVDGNKIQTRGYGESQPVADNGSAAGRAKNRRVEIKVSGDVVDAAS